MEQEVLYTFGFLFNEIKRRLYNTDDPRTWNAKCVEFVRALRIKDLNSPGGLPPVLDAIWHEAVLNTKAYYQLCFYLRGVFIHHETNSEQDNNVERISRIDHTVLAYRRQYEQEPDSTIWNDDAECVIEPPTYNYQIFIKMLDGVTRTMDVRANTFVSAVKAQIQQWTGIPTCMHRLIYAGKQFDDSKTLWDYGVTQYSTLHFCLRVGGC
jgi:hypothetical protein